MGKVGEFIAKGAEWVQNHQELVRIIMLVVLCLGGFLTVAGSVIAAVGGVGLVFTKTAGFVTGFIGTIKKLPGLLDTVRIYGMYAGDGVKKGFSLITNSGAGAINSVKNVALNITSMAKTAAISGVNALKSMATGLVGMAKQALTTASTALGPLITSVWSFTAALLANPITWVVIGIVALIAGIVLLYNKCEWFRNLVDNIVSAVGEKLGAALEVAKTVFHGIGNVIGTVMEAASATVSEKLGNMKAAYEAHGGGIQGVAAAAIEGVKGYYTAGFTFIDNLTGGKLSEIRDRFSQGIQNVKNVIMDSLSWFRESGKKILTTFTEGIKSAISAPVEAVKGGLQKIRNMLPFSDAKTGPLSTLTLSGHRTMTTYATGLQQAVEAPAEVMEGALSRISTQISPQSIVEEPETVGITATRGPVRTIERREISREKETSSTTSEKDTGVSINEFHLTVDFSKIKELPMLLKFLREIEDYANANGLVTQGEG